MCFSVPVWWTVTVAKLSNVSNLGLGIACILQNELHLQTCFAQQPGVAKVEVLSFLQFFKHADSWHVSVPS